MNTRFPKGFNGVAGFFCLSQRGSYRVLTWKNNCVAV